MAQDPRDGLPPIIDPVFIWQTPAEWLMPSATQDRMTAMSSSIFAVCGMSSEAHVPALPCCFQVLGHPKSGEPLSPIEVMTLPKLSGSFLPASLLSRGLGSNKSIWLGPPSMNRKMTDLALPKWWGILDERGLEMIASVAVDFAAKRELRARAPNPEPAWASHCLREEGESRKFEKLWSCSMFIWPSRLARCLVGLFNIQKFA